VTIKTSFDKFKKEMSEHVYTPLINKKIVKRWN
jgi:hypothetical protein